MRILMGGYLPSYEPEEEGEISLGKVGGGGAISTFNLARKLVEKGIDVEFIAPGLKNFRGKVDGIHVVYDKEFLSNFKNNLEIMGTQKSPLAYDKHKKIFFNIFKKGEFDIYHSLGGIFCIGPTLAANEYGIPSVMTINNHWPVCFFSKWCWNEETCRGCGQLKFTKCIFREGLSHTLMSPILLAIKNKSMAMRQRAIEEADKIVPVSEYLKDTLIRFGFEAGKIVPIYDIFQPQKRAKQEYLPYFCCVGRIVREKGLKYALYAMQKVVDEHPEARLLIIGEESPKSPLVFLSQKEKIIRLTRKLGMSKNVTFTGWIPHNGVLDIISKSTAVVFPSVCPEAFGMAVLEGMACGRPAIVTDQGGTPEIVENMENGIIVPPRDSRGLAKEMIYLLDNPVEVKRMGRNAFETVKRKFDPDIIANKHINLYQRLIA